VHECRVADPDPNPDQSDLYVLWARSGSLVRDLDPNLLIIMLK
jgi:hypothetical protein